MDKPRSEFSEHQLKLPKVAICKDCAARQVAAQKAGALSQQAAARKEVLFCNGENCQKDKPRSDFIGHQLLRPKEAICKGCVLQAAARKEVLFCNGENCQKDKPRSDFSGNQLLRPKVAICEECVASKVARKQVLFCNGESCRKEKPRSAFSNKELKHPKIAICEECVPTKVRTLVCGRCKVRQRCEFFSECESTTSSYMNNAQKRRCNTCLADNTAAKKAQWADDVASVQRLDHQGTSARE